MPVAAQRHGRGAWTPDKNRRAVQAVHQHLMCFTSTTSHAQANRKHTQGCNQGVFVTFEARLVGPPEPPASDKTRRDPRLNDKLYSRVRARDEDDKAV